MPWIREQWGIDVTPAHFSTIKTGLRKGKKVKGKKAKAVPASRYVVGRPAVQQGTPAVNGTQVPVAAVAEVRELIRKYGQRAVWELASALGD